MLKRGDWRYDDDWDAYELWDGAQWRVFPREHFVKRGFKTIFDVEKAVARSELTIKLVSYNDSKDAQEAIIEAAREAARTLVTVAMMLQDKRSPEVSLFTEDFFEGTKELVVDTEGHATDD